MNERDGLDRVLIAGLVFFGLLTLFALFGLVMALMGVGR